MRFAVLYGGVVADWQGRCLAALASLPEVEAAASLAPEPRRVAPSGAPVAALAPEAIDRLQALALDFILCFMEGPLPARLIELPRHGIWRYVLGDWANYRGAPGGFWEVFDGCAASAVLLVRVTPDPDVVEVLREGVLRTQRLSVRKNRQQFSGALRIGRLRSAAKSSPAEPGMPARGSARSRRFDAARGSDRLPPRGSACCSVGGSPCARRPSGFARYFATTSGISASWTSPSNSS